MKKLFTLLMIAALMVPLSGSAQDDDDKKRRKKRTRQHFLFELGLNNYMTNGQFPDQSNELYTVRPVGSWNVALGTVYRTPVAGPLFLEWGGNVSWYNFKFQDASVEISEDASGVVFQQNQDLSVEPIKSKLTVSYVNASFVPMIRLGNHNNALRFGAGVYGGYRLGSYYKLKYERDGQKLKQKTRDNYYLENLRYGVRARFGFKDFDLYANYDLNNLFIDGRGPQLQGVSAGIILSDVID